MHGEDRAAPRPRRRGDPRAERAQLGQPFAWEELKRALGARQLRIEPLERLVGLGGPSTLEPEPVPLDVKVVLVGDRLVWLLLSPAPRRSAASAKALALAGAVDLGEACRRVREDRRYARFSTSSDW